MLMMSGIPKQVSVLGKDAHHVPIDDTWFASLAKSGGGRVSDRCFEDRTHAMFALTRRLSVLECFRKLPRPPLDAARVQELSRVGRLIFIESSLLNHMTSSN